VGTLIVRKTVPKVVPRALVAEQARIADRGSRVRRVEEREARGRVSDNGGSVTYPQTAGVPGSSGPIPL